MSVEQRITQINCVLIKEINHKIMGAKKSSSRQVLAVLVSNMNEFELAVNGRANFVICVSNLFVKIKIPKKSTT